LQAVNDEIKSLLTPEFLRSVVDAIPASWAETAEAGLSAAEVREVYYQFLTRRIEHSDNFLNEAIHARQVLV
jgi:4-hydroxyphenylpyruvate dioxygenase-like putative hemolysin